MIDRVQRLRKRLSLIGSNRLSAFDTVSLIAHQLHDETIVRSVLDSFVLADGVFVKSSKRSRLNSPAGMPVAGQWVCNPVYGYWLRDVYTHLGAGVVYLPDSGKYFLETGWGWGKYRTLSLNAINRRKRYELNSGNPIYVFSGSGYHGVVEDLAAILLLLDRGIRFDLVIDPHDKWMLGLVDLFVPLDINRIFLTRDLWVKSAVTLSITKSAFGEFVNPSFIARLNKEAKTVARAGASGKFFVSRSDSAKRNCSNERALEKRFLASGYHSVVLGNMDVREQVSLFRSASSVAGMHGAGFVNLVWSDPGVSVEEFYLGSHFNSCYAALSECLGHEYSCKDVTSS